MAIFVPCVAPHVVLYIKYFVFTNCAFVINLGATFVSCIYKNF
jgi:hypothetical protein